MLLNYLINHHQLTGYEFIKFCNDNGIPASSGNVYPQIKALEDCGMITFQEEGKKKIYTLTKQGKEKLSQTPLHSTPEFLKNMFFKNLHLASAMDWNNVADVQKLLGNVEEIKNFLEMHIGTLTGSTNGESKDQTVFG